MGHRMRAGILLIISMLFLQFTAAGQGDQEKISIKMNAWGGTLGAWLHLPDDYNTTTERYPLLVFFHGVGEGGTDLNKVLVHGVPKKIAQGAKMEYTVNGKLYKFIAVSPQAPSGWMNENNVDAILEYLKATYRVDVSRIYLTGISAGGYATWNYVMAKKEFADKVAAIVPVSAAGAEPQYESNFCNFAESKVAMWTLCGSADQFIEVANNYVTKINACNPTIPAIKTIKAGAGHSGSYWDECYDITNKYNTPNIYEWMLGYSRDGVTQPEPPANQPPVSRAGSNITITLPTNTAALDGSTSSDADGSIAAWAWRKVSGPAGGTISAANASKTNVTALVQGTYVYELKVTDNKGATATSQVSVIVNAASVPAPVAKLATTSINITLPTATAILDGSTSTGDITAWAWTKVSGPSSGTIATATSSKTTVSGLTTGTYVYELKVTGAGGSSTARVNVTVLAAPTNPGACSSCKLTITKGNDGGANIDGSKYNLQPGDTICIKADNYVYIELYNFTGSAEKPLVFINCGGIVRMGETSFFGMNFRNCKYFKVTGTGTTDKYGFRISGVTKYLSSGLAAGKGCSDYEFDHIEVHKTEAGFLCKINPACDDPNSVYPNFTIRNIKFHDLYIHDLLGEGMYIGNTSPQGLDLTCNGVTTKVVPPKIENCTIYNVITDSTGWDGIQVSGAYKGLNIYNNRITNFGMEGKGSQQAGIIFGGEGNGSVYNNFIHNGSGNGMQIFGGGMIYVYNNIVSNVGTDPDEKQDGIFIDDKPTNYEYKPIQAQVFSNTIIQPGRNGIMYYDSRNTSESCRIFNNLVVDPGSPDSKGDKAYIEIATTVPLEISNNLYLATVAEAKFRNPAGLDFHLAEGSPAIDFGRSLASIGSFLTRDIDGDVRPYGTTFDAGADEFTGNSAPVNQPPIAKANSPIHITLPTNTVSLDGSSSSDPDGSITTWKWLKVSGPNGGNITSAAAAKTSVTALEAGTYVFRLVLTDDDNAKDSTDVSVIVAEAVNQPPHANAGSDIRITLPTNTATLSGTGSSDPDGTITNWKWTKVSGPNGGNITASGANQTTVTSLEAGTYVFQIKITDNDGASDSSTVSVIVADIPNTAPVANAGNNIFITLPVNHAELDGTRSTDADGTISNWHWRKTAGPANFDIASPEDSKTAVSNLTEGMYTFELIVMDNDRAADTATVYVTVLPTANAIPEALAGPDQEITLPTNIVELDGSASHDTDGSIVKWLWYKVSGPESGTISNDDNSTTSVTGLTQGSYVFRLIVTDDRGMPDSAEVTITVLRAPNQAPVANAGADHEITLPINNVMLDGSASRDSDGTIDTWLWTKISGPQGGTIVSNNTTYTEISNLIAGTYVYELTVTDNEGVTAKDRVTVLVNPVVNKPPVANAGPDVTLTLPASSTTLDGTQSNDPDGSIQSWQWTYISGPSTFGIANANTSKTLLSNLLAGTYVFELTVTDNKGATAKDRISIRVQDSPNTPPVANAGIDQTISLPLSSVNLNGTASSDADGTISSYEWAQVYGASADIINGTSANATVEGLAAGEYIFELTVTDNKGATATSRVNITVLAAPTIPPVALAGDDISIDMPESSVTLDGSASYDPDGQIRQYQWRIVSGPGTATITDRTQSRTRILGMEEGEYIIELAVTDNSNATSKSTLKVTVVNPSTVITLDMYPNPAVDFIRVTVKGKDIRNATGYIYNSSGRIEHTVQIGSPQSSWTDDVPVKGLSNGLYIFRVTGENLNISKSFMKISR